MSNLSPLLSPTGLTVDLGGGRRAALVELLGKGALSAVYRGLLETHYGLRCAVAVKLFAAVSSEEIELVLGSLANAVARAASVRHPNVAAVYEFGMCESQPYVVSELVDGMTLERLVQIFAERRERLPLDLSLFLATEVAEALSGARTARDDQGVRVGMHHLGLTPREVLLSWQGEVKVTDFEVSTMRNATSSVRSLAAVARRANMMSPEVAQGGPGDARSDVFSLGVLARELLIGPRFPKSLTSSEAIRLAREGFVQPMCFQPHLPAELLAILSRALEIEPANRYPNATSMVYDLRRVALAMGASDGRYFLRCALGREMGDEAEITAERPFRASPPPPRPARHGGSRRRRK